MSTAASDSFSDYGKLIVSVSRAARTLEIIATNNASADGQGTACADSSTATSAGTTQPRAFDIALRNVRRTGATGPVVLLQGGGQ